MDAAGYDLIDVPRSALADAPPGAAGTARVRVYTLSSMRGGQKAVAKPAVAAAAKPAKPRREPAQKKVKRVRLKDAPVVGKGAAERDRGAARLRSYANADADEVLAKEEAGE